MKGITFTGNRTLDVMNFDDPTPGPRDVVLEIRRYPLQPANCNWFLLDPGSTAGRFARAITRSTEHARKNVAFPINQVGVGVAFLRNQPDVLGHRRMRRTGVLAIHDFVEIFRIGCVSRFQDLFSTYPQRL